MSSDPAEFLQGETKRLQRLMKALELHVPNVRFDAMKKSVLRLKTEASPLQIFKTCQCEQTLTPEDFEKKTAELEKVNVLLLQHGFPKEVIEEAYSQLKKEEFNGTIGLPLFADPDEQPWALYLFLISEREADDITLGISAVRIDFKKKAMASCFGVAPDPKKLIDFMRSVCHYEAVVDLFDLALVRCSQEMRICYKSYPKLLTDDICRTSRASSRSFFGSRLSQTQAV